MPEKMHLFGLLSPIFHPVRVKEVKDINTGNIYTSLLLSLLSPPYACATRFSPVFPCFCVRWGERGKEVRKDTPTAAYLSFYDRCARPSYGTNAPRWRRVRNLTSSQARTRPYINSTTWAKNVKRGSPGMWGPDCKWFLRQDLKQVPAGEMVKRCLFLSATRAHG